MSDFKKFNFAICSICPQSLEGYKIDKIGELYINSLKPLDIKKITKKEIFRRKFSIIIPILNEKNNIPIIIKKIKFSLKKYKYEVIFVDDDSNDGSHEILNFLSKKIQI